MHDIIKIVKLFEDSEVLIDGVTEAVKHCRKKTRSVFLGTLLALLAAPAVQHLITIGRGVMTVGRGFYNSMDKNF